MAQAMRRYYVVGDYMVGKQIGAGSFSTVWHARHRVHGTEVAIKEIVTTRLNPKLQESLKSEIFILKRINHPNIIRLHDMIEEPGKIYIVLEYCKGGDLSMYIQQRQGKIPEATAKHFMQQLAEGLKVLRENNLIHRDLKPQLLQNIMKSVELQFPPEAKDLSPHCLDLCRKLLRRNPVERLTFEEFFNHPYISDRQPEESYRNRQPQRVSNDFPFSERNAEESPQEDCLPFSLDYDSSGPDGSPSFRRRSTMRSMHGFSLDSKPDRRDIFNLANRPDSSKYSSIPCKTEIIGSGLGSRQLSEGNLKESLKTTGLGSPDRRPKVVDSLESIDQDYVIVSGPPLDISSSTRASKPSQFPPKIGSPPVDSRNTNATSDPVPIIGGASGRVCYTGNVESRLSTPRTSQGSMDVANTFEQPSTDCMMRIKSLQHCASSITELVNEKMEGEKQLEAFSLQLVILAIWKQALDICHTHAASAIEGSSSLETTRSREVSKVQQSPDDQECHSIDNTQGPQHVCSEIERAFLHEVGNAEELAKVIEPGNMEMPDAMELIYQSALALGRRGAVEEYMGDIENAVLSYSKAVRLLRFILVEAPSLILNPPFSLTNSDRYRIKNYIDVLSNRQSISQSQRMALFKVEDRPCVS
ncbi:UNVERIFIED_CONTAM: Serine/threonine-protein kinase ATG1c [Sesamum indicum]